MIINECKDRIENEESFVEFPGGISDNGMVNEALSPEVVKELKKLGYTNKLISMGYLNKPEDQDFSVKVKRNKDIKNAIEIFGSALLGYSITKNTTNGFGGKK